MVCQSDLKILEECIRNPPEAEQAATAGEAEAGSDPLATDAVRVRCAATVAPAPAAVEEPEPDAGPASATPTSRRHSGRRITATWRVTDS